MKTLFVHLIFTFGIASLSQALPILVGSESIHSQLKGVEVYAEESQLTLLIDGAQIASLPQLHEALLIGLNLPSSYGKNLDALYDILTEQNTPSIRFVFQNTAKMRENLGERHYNALMQTIRNAKANAHHLVLEFL